MAETVPDVHDIANLSLDDIDEDGSNVPGASRGNGDQLKKVNAKEDEGKYEKKYGSESSWEDDEYPPQDLNYDALRAVAARDILGNHGNCTEIHSMERGSFHEIRVLEFEDGWSCIGRFTRRRDEHRHVLESTYATVKYVKEHSSIPVPEIYSVNFDQQNDVGAPFVIMEKIPGVRLDSIWEKLSTEHKTLVIKQLAGVLAQLSNLRFDKIGSININGEVGPLQSLAIPHDIGERGPFNTMEDFLFSFIQDSDDTPTKTSAFYPDIRRRIHEDLEEQTDDSLYNPPFRLIHNDFDGQNMLFTWPDACSPPKLSAIIDWDQSYTGPLYYLYEYPGFIHDVEDMYNTHKWPENKILRKKLVSALVQTFPKGSEDRLDVREAFRQKSYLYNSFAGVFMTRLLNEERKYSAVNFYADGLAGKNTYGGYPYGGKVFWEPDSESESEDGDCCCDAG